MAREVLMVRRAWADRRGVTAVEYAVIAGVLVAAVASAFAVLGPVLQNVLAGLNL